MGEFENNQNVSKLRQENKLENAFLPGVQAGLFRIDSTASIAAAFPFHYKSSFHLRTNIELYHELKFMIGQNC